MSDVVLSETVVRYPVQGRYESVAELIAAGGYDYVNEGIRVERIGPKGIWPMDIDEDFLLLPYVRKKDFCLSLMFASFFELCAFAALYPEKQLEHPVAAEGNGFRNTRGPVSVPLLDEVGGGRWLRLQRVNRIPGNAYCLLRVPWKLF